MMILFRQIIEILAIPPVNLVFRSFLSVSFLIGFLNLFQHSKNNQTRKTTELFIGFFLLMTFQFVVMIIAAFYWNDYHQYRLAIPPLERTVYALNLIWIIWLLVFSKSSKWINLAVGLSSSFVLVLYLITLSGWKIISVTSAYNFSQLDWIWLGVSFLFTAVGIFLLFRPPNHGRKLDLVILLLLFVGFPLHIFFAPADGDFASLPLLLQIFAIPIFLLRTDQIIMGIDHKQLEEQDIEPDHWFPKFRTDPRSIEAWLALVGKQPLKNSASAISKAIALTLGADFCYLLSSPYNSKAVTILAGYDLLKEENLEGTFFSNQDLPDLYQSLQTLKQFEWKKESKDHPDSIALKRLTRLEQPDNLMFIPWLSKNNIPFGFLILTPFSRKEWNDEDRKLLFNMAEVIDRNILSNEIGELSTNGWVPEEMINASEGLNSSSYESFSQVEGLISVQNDLRMIIDALQDENDQLHDKLRNQTAKTTPNVDYSREIETELKMSLKEVAHLQNALAESNLRILALQQEPDTLSSNSNKNEPVDPIINDVRKPMASIIGYCDLLLSESVGILGVMQRKFLERIKDYIESMNPLLSRLDEYSENNSTKKEMEKLGFSIPSMIDNCLINAAPLIRQKNLSLRVDFCDSTLFNLQPPEDLEKILYGLMNNTVIASPQDGIIDFKIHKEQKSSEKINLVISVGLSITSDEDAPFHRQVNFSTAGDQGGSEYSKVEDLLLAEIKMLIEKQNGQFQIDTGRASETFMVTLPLNPG